MSDHLRTAKDVAWRHAGIGMSPNFMCMGCNKQRQPLGSKGKGAAKRCVDCLAKREAKARPASSFPAAA